MHILLKSGILQRTLNYSRISQVFISSSHYTALLENKNKFSPLEAQKHYLMKLPSINFSTSMEMNGTMQNIKNKLSNFMSSNTKAKLGACLAFERCTDTIDFQEFFKFFELPDSFQSWFNIVQLHVWMCILIAITEKNGRIFRTHIVDSMWADIEIRLSQMKEVRSSHRKKFLNQINDQFRASQIAFDEGVLLDDTVLAAAVWRTIFGFRNVDPRVLEAMVFYIRKQISHLDHQNAEEILFKGAVDFIPLKTITDQFSSI